MKAVQFASFGAPAQVCRVVELPDPPPPGPREIQVQVLRATINPADLLQIEGKYAVPPPLPHVPGTESVGRVIALGPDTAGLAVGDLVALLPGDSWRTRMNLRASLALKLPAGIDLAQAAMVKANPTTAEAMLTGYVPLEAGDYVIQNAANSAVGRAAIKLARRRGVKTINVVRRDGPVDALKRDGADVVLVDALDDAEAFARRVRAAVGRDAKIKLGFDAIGGDATNALMAAVSDNGLVLNYGLLSGQACRAHPNHLVFRNVALRGFWLRTWIVTLAPAASREVYGRLIGLVHDGTLKGEVEAVYPLARLGEALAHAGRGGRDGKIQIDFSGA